MKALSLLLRMLATCVLIAVILAGLGVAGPGQATEDGYPNRPVRLIVPYSPGGSSDVLGRTLADELSKRLGQTFVVENRSGAGATLGTDAVAKSTADGYTLLLADMPHAINPSVYEKLAYDPVGDFRPVTLIGQAPLMLFVKAGSRFDSLESLIEAADRDPGSITIGSGGNGTATHLFAELFQTRSQIKLNHVPYRGAAPALTDLVAGQIDAMFTNPASADAFVKSGQLKILGITTLERHPAFEDIPTFKEQGVADLVAEHWFGVLAPAGTPETIVAALNREIRTIVEDPEILKRFRSLGVTPLTSSSDDFSTLVRTEIARWGVVVKAAGIPLQ